jgi:hypothetical protein
MMNDFHTIITHHNLGMEVILSKCARELPISLLVCKADGRKSKREVMV